MSALDITLIYKNILLLESLPLDDCNRYKNAQKYETTQIYL